MELRRRFDGGRGGRRRRRCGARGPGAVSEAALKTAEADILILPGLGNSGPDHWQRRWAERLSTARVVEQEDWQDPHLHIWVGAIVRETIMSTLPVVLVAHSLGVIAAAHAAQQMKDTKVRGALLVAPPDLEREDVARPAARFAPVPRDPLPFPSLLVASTDDPYASIESAADLAAAWGSDFHIAGAMGHINAASGHGPWPEGLLMFSRLMQRLKG
jgi:predicted alpha/beta hydrolase family esterase